MLLVTYKKIKKV
jgi:hypothetical protein